MARRKKDIPDLLTFLRVPYQEVADGAELVLGCFTCGKDNHLYYNKDSGAWICHKCGEAGGLHSFEQGLLTWVVESAASVPDTYWGAKRGLSEDTIRTAKLGYYAPLKAYTIPYFEGERHVTNIAFRMAGDEEHSGGNKYLKLPGYPVLPYFSSRPDRNHDGRGQVILLTEGEIDALSVSQATGGTALGVATGGAAQVGQTLLESLPSDARIVVCFDNDLAGRRGAAKIKERIPSARVLRLPDPIKDLNQLLVERGPEAVALFLEGIEGVGESAATDRELPRRALPSSVYITLPDDNESWLIEDLWLDRSLGFVAGIPKALKSTLALHLAYAVSVGKPFAAKKILRPGPVLMFQEEDNDYVIKSRLRVLNAGMGSADLHIATPGITGIHLRLDSEASLEILDEEIQRVQPVLVILDPLANMHSLEDENSAGAINKILERIRFLRDLRKCSFMIVHHLRKARDDGEDASGQRMRGSSVLHAKSESSLYIAKYGNLLRVTVENKISPTRVVELRFTGKEFLAEDDYSLPDQPEGQRGGEAHGLLG